MRYRFTGAVVAMTLATAVLLTVAPIAQQGRGNAPAAPAARPPAPEPEAETEAPPEPAPAPAPEPVAEEPTNG